MERVEFGPLTKALMQRPTKIAHQIVGAMDPHMTGA